MQSFLGKIYIKAYFFRIFVTNKIFKSFLPKGTLLGTNILSMTTFFVEIGPLR